MPHERRRGADEGYFRKRDLSGAAAAAPAGGAARGRWRQRLSNTEIGQIIVLAYLDAYKKLVTELGGLNPPPPPAPTLSRPRRRRADRSLNPLREAGPLLSVSPSRCR